jgi:ABC-2 type transport system ATP-binding protein
MIRVKNLTKRFGSVTAVDNITFTVNEGEILGFQGPNGAGKSTTMRIITCFIPPTSGTVQVDRFDIFHHSREIRGLIGYLPENAPLYPEMRVYQYLSFRAALKGVPARRIGEQIEYVMGLTNIHDRRNDIIGHLSKGYRQRVGIADCMLNEPRVLILDEPTVGLDPLQIQETRSMFQDLRNRCTIIISTHILSEVQVTCDRALVINRGRLIAEESIRDLTGEKIISFEISPPEDDIDAVATVLKSLAPVADVSAEQKDDRCRFTVQCRKSKDARNALSVKAAEEGWQILELSAVPRSLEEVFKHLVLEEEAGHAGSIS